MIPAAKQSSHTIQYHITLRFLPLAIIQTLLLKDNFKTIVQDEHQGTIDMDIVEADLTPGQDWRESLNATCNRLSTQYMNLLRAASSVSALEKGNASNGTVVDPRAGGGKMMSLQDPPPPPLAADVASSSLQCQLAVENICVASSQLLSLIRTLRLSILMMDEEAIAAEEELQVLEVEKITMEAQRQANQLEKEWMELRNSEFGDE